MTQEVWKREFVPRLPRQRGGGPLMRPARLCLSLRCSLTRSSPCAVDTDRLPDPALQERYDALTHELRCMQCQNQSIADSPVGLASDLRREVRDMLLAGKIGR